MNSNELLGLGILVILFCMFSGLSFVYGYQLGSAKQHEGICIEREMYCPDYSDMDHPCFKQKCTVPDDAIINNKRYDVDGTPPKYNITTGLPDYGITNDLIFPIGRDNPCWNDTQTIGNFEINYYDKECLGVRL